MHTCTYFENPPTGISTIMYINNGAAVDSVYQSQAKDKQEEWGNEVRKTTSMWAVCKITCDELFNLCLNGWKHFLPSTEASPGKQTTAVVFSSQQKLPGGSKTVDVVPSEFSEVFIRNSQASPQIIWTNLVYIINKETARYNKHIWPVLITLIWL